MLSIQAVHLQRFSVVLCQQKMHFLHIFLREIKGYFLISEKSLVVMVYVLSLSVLLFLS